MQDAQRKCKDINTLLRDKGIRFGMLYLAWLKVDTEGKVHIFSNPSEAATYCKKHLNVKETHMTVSPSPLAPDSNAAMAKG